MPNPLPDKARMASSRRRIACIGEVMIELSPAGPDTYKIGVAGDTFNTAVYLSRLLGEKTSVYYVTAIGTDAQSARIMAALEGEGVDTSFVEQLQDESPGLYMVSLDPQGERSFSYWRSAAAARKLLGPSSRFDLRDLAGFDLVYFSAISVAILPQASRNALHDGLVALRAAGVRVAFDSNYRPRLWEDVETARREVMRFWSVADIALPSADDEMALFGDESAAAVMRRLMAAGITCGSLKRGATGPIALDGTACELGELPPAKVVDTTAAGDSFNAGFIASHLQGASLMEAMASGDKLARLVIGHAGAIVPRN